MAPDKSAFCSLTPKYFIFCFSDCQIQGNKLLMEVNNVLELWDSHPNARPFLKDLKIMDTNLGDFGKDCKAALEKLHVTLAACVMDFSMLMADFLAQMWDYGLKW